MLAEILHKVAEFDSEENHPYHPRPSLAGPQRCIRSLDYYAQGYERKPFPGRFITVLDDSSWHEQLIKDWIRKSAYAVHSEQMEVNCGTVNGHPIKGHIDGIITDMLGVDRLLEIKAISHFGFQEIWAGNLPLDYITQTFLYLKGLEEINPDINQAVLLIKNKNQSQYLDLLLRSYPGDVGVAVGMTLSTGERKEIYYVINGVTQSALDRFEEIEEYRSLKKLHDRQYERSHWRCQYCQYGAICWENYEEEFEARLEEGTLPEDISDGLKYYLELNGHISQMEKEKEAIRSSVLAALLSQNAKKATLNEYVVTVRLQPRTSLDKEAPEELLKRCTKTTYSEVLNIRRKKK